ncbi:MAG: helix-turn-helix transcriptional regulator [Clostridia bacterium]|nr:helix-turn-helix transcriptional regulator [Clostridia bacterium]
MNYLYKNILSAQPIHTIHKRECRPDYDRLDFHPHYELYLCPSACVQQVTLNGTIYRIDRPCAIISRPYTVHYMLPEDAGASVFERYVVYFDETFLSAFGDWIFPKTLFASSRVAQLNSADMLLETLRPVFDERRTMGERAAHLSAFFAAFAAEETVCTTIVPPEDGISRILEYISSHPGEDLNGDTLAARFHVSRAKLDRDFRSFVGQSVHQTVMDCRLHEAMVLLRGSDLAMREIALRCGFESEQYFYAFFRRRTGRTPGDYRKTVESL